jgi:hypothetical protein
MRVFSKWPDESGIIISAALRRLTVSAQMLLVGESNAEEQYQGHRVSIHHSDSFPPPGCCTSAGWRSSLSSHGAS